MIPGLYHRFKLHRSDRGKGQELQARPYTKKRCPTTAYPAIVRQCFFCLSETRQTLLALAFLSKPIQLLTTAVTARTTV